MSFFAFLANPKINMKQPIAPTKAFTFFVKKFRADNDLHENFTKTLHAVRPQWEAMEEEAKRPFEELARKDLERYHNELEQFEKENAAAAGQLSEFARNEGEAPLKAEFADPNLWPKLRERGDIRVPMDGATWAYFRGCLIRDGFSGNLDEYGFWLKGFEQKLSFGAFNKLEDGHMLNVALLNIYLELICEENEGVQFFSLGQMDTFAQSWTFEANFPLETTRLVLAPIVFNRHVAMGVVDLIHFNVNIFDSANSRSTKKIKEWAAMALIEMVRAMAKKQGGQFESRMPAGHKWPRNVSCPVAQQVTNVDCGVFSMNFGRMAAEGRPFNFDQSHVPFLRRMMAQQILAKASISI